MQAFFLNSFVIDQALDFRCWAVNIRILGKSKIRVSMENKKKKQSHKSTEYDYNFSKSLAHT